VSIGVGLGVYRGWLMGMSRGWVRGRVIWVDLGGHAPKILWPLK